MTLSAALLASYQSIMQSQPAQIVRETYAPVVRQIAQPTQPTQTVQPQQVAQPAPRQTTTTQTYRDDDRKIITTSKTINPQTTAQQFESGRQHGMGQEATIPHTIAKPQSEFWTSGIGRFALEKGADYRRFVESHRGKIEKAVDILHGPLRDRPAFERMHGTAPPIKASTTYAPVVVGIAKVPAGFIETTGMAAVGVEYIVRHPGEAATIVAPAAGVAVGGITRSFQERPHETAGEFIGMVFGPRAVSKIPRPKTPARAPSSVKTPTGLTPGKTTKFEAGAKLASELGREKPPTTPVDYTQIKYLPGKSGSAVEQWIKTHPQQTPVVGGSTAARVHFPSARVSKDVDLLVREPHTAATEIFEVVKRAEPTEQWRLGPYEQKWGAQAVEIKRGGEWHHAVDIHKTIPEGSKLRFGFETQKPVEVGGIKYQRAGELIQRKGEAVLQPSDPGTIGPTKTFRPRRQKDIPDFESQVSDVLKIRRGQAEQARLFSGRKQAKVEQLEESFETYKMHSQLGPDPYMVALTAEKYGATPVYGRAAIAFAGVGGNYYLAVQEPSTQQAHHPITEPIIKDNYIPPSRYPVKKDEYVAIDYEPLILKEGYIPPSRYLQDTPKTSTYVPPYEPATQDDSTYTPPYIPYEPLHDQTYTPPSKPPVGSKLLLPPTKPERWPRLKIDDELEEKKKKKSKPLVHKGRKIKTWYPAGYASVTKEHLQTGGKLSTHISDPATTRTLIRKFFKTGKPIPTAKQHRRKR